MRQRRKVGVIGSGMVGQTLAAGFHSHGDAVMVGTRTPAQLSAWQNGAGTGVAVGSVAEAASFGELLVLAVKGASAQDVLYAAGAANLDGKLILDTTNPIDTIPAVAGVLHFFTTLEDSLLERLQRTVPKARFVKAWNSVGAALMVDPRLPGGPPTMFICGNDPEARREAAAILDEFGWEVEDLGAAPAARAVEPLCLLWCIPGFLANDWVHAFKMLRP